MSGVFTGSRRARCRDSWCRCPVTCNCDRRSPPVPSSLVDMAIVTDVVGTLNVSRDVFAGRRRTVMTTASRLPMTARVVDSRHRFPGRLSCDSRRTVPASAGDHEWRFCRSPSCRCGSWNTNPVTCNCDRRSPPVPSSLVDMAILTDIVGTLNVSRSFCRWPSMPL